LERFLTSASALLYWHAALWQNGKVTDLGTFGGSESETSAINEQGEIVGRADTDKWYDLAFRWRNGKMRDLGTLFVGEDSEAVAINDRGQIVGESGRSFHRYAILWDKGKLIRLTRQRTSWAVAINERGQIVGQSSDARGGTARQAI
jgi:probable HAF family extracellular repeat protein